VYHLIAAREAGFIQDSDLHKVDSAARRAQRQPATGCEFAKIFKIGDRIC